MKSIHIKALLMAVAIFCCVLLQMPARAEDVPYSDPNVEEAEALGLVPDWVAQRGYREPMSRAEFAGLAMHFLAAQYQLPGDSEGFTARYAETHGLAEAAAFSDAPDALVTCARTLGLVQGRDDARFDPDAAITWQEVATILRRVYCLYGDTEAPKTLPALARDEGEVAAWAQEGVRFTDALGLLRFSYIDNLAGPCTREFCVVSLLSLYKRVPVCLYDEGVAPLRTREAWVEVLLGQMMADVHFSVKKQIELPMCTVLEGGFWGFTQPLDYDYLIFNDGRIIDIESALRASLKKQDAERDWGTIISVGVGSSSEDGSKLRLGATFDKGVYPYSSQSFTVNLLFKDALTRQDFLVAEEETSNEAAAFAANEVSTSSK